MTPPGPSGRPPPVPRDPLFLLDYDGTLAPIVDDPLDAHPHAAVPGLLAELSSAHPLYVVTGRALDDLARLLAVPVDAVGLHGAQQGRLGSAARLRMAPPARRALREWRDRAPSLDGLRVEAKGPAFALHYRGASDEAAVEAALRTWLADVPPSLVAVWGKKVLELRPKGISKGRVARELSAAHAARTPVYLGDDTTDEDAFEALAEDDRAVTIKVGEGETGARYRLPDVPAVVTYLRSFLSRPRPSA